MAYVRSSALARRNTGMNAYLSAYYGRRRIGLGDVSASEAESLGNDVGALVGVPGAGSIAAPIVDTIAQVFGSSPTGANAQRAAKMYAYYSQAMTDPGSSASICAVLILQSIANAGMTPACDTASSGLQNNPQATRTFAGQALEALSQQGWENVYTSNPMYTGIAQSGVIYGANSQGQQVAVAQTRLPATAASLGSSPLLWILLLGGGALLLSRSSSSSSSTVVHHNRVRRNRSHRRHRRGGRV